ncbi:ABZJ_00895 family protein [Jannaschia pohangensis]|uniref:Uncharacterized protein n=1 Tax=Jannaschia pohangensis TaxID=390807 RepID=A0A1I3SP66_9RHOB|nr:ABZJ_00895 family protein [Jannaschia pohangensis]SFJ60313.1 hypothetical protein SAMN04488095_3221 [Jannaschia pohangensis]
MQEIQPWIGRYALTLVLTWGGLMVVGVLLSRFAGISLPGGAVAILPPIAAAMVTGQAWARQTGALPPNGPAWKLACVGALLYFMMQIVVAGGAFASLSRVTEGVVTPDRLFITFGLLAVLCVVSAGVGRLFLTFGAKSALKA